MRHRQAGVTEGVERVLRASARAHRRTGAPIHTHTNGARTGLEQQRIFNEEDVDLSRVMIGHVDRTAAADRDALARLMDAGSMIGFDSFGFKPSFLAMESDETRLRWISELCVSGYSDRLVLAHDQTSYDDLEPYDMQVQKRRTRGVHTWWPLVGLPALRTLGVNEIDIHQMTVLNPRRFFESLGRGAY